MTYDIFFELRETSKIERDTLPNELSKWFSNRPFTVVEGNSALYENSDTNVYFYWDWDFKDIDDQSENTILEFSINLFRPSPFIFEAHSELAAIRSEFELDLYDLQSDKEGPSTPEEVILQYQKSGASTAKVTLESIEGEVEYYLLPRQNLERMWAWNFQKETLQADVGDDYFVPAFIAVNGETTTTCFVWIDGTPSVIPRVETVFIVRDKTAPRLGVFKKKEETVDILTWEQWHNHFGHLYEVFDKKEGTLIAKDVCPRDAKKALTAFKAKGTTTMRERQQNGSSFMIPFEKILDVEFFQ